MRAHMTCIRAASVYLTFVCKCVYVHVLNSYAHTLTLIVKVDTIV